MTDLHLLKSPWANEFQAFSRSVIQNALLVSPFITRGPLQQFAQSFGAKLRPTVEILTNLSIDNLAQGTTDPESILEFRAKIPNTGVTHLPGLHAKVYVADNRIAIVTSANLTGGGVSSNYEYGVWIEDSHLVERITSDLRSYATLGVQISPLDLEQLASVSKELRLYQSRVVSSARRTLRIAFQRRIDDAHEMLREMRAKPGETTNAIFSRTILFLLQKGPLTTRQLHPLIRQIHPDLCDDSIDRVIGGVHFGKWWKHMVRNAQQSLKNQGQVQFNDGKWFLPGSA